MVAKYLNFVEYRDFGIWQFTRNFFYANKKLKFNLVKLNDLLIQVKKSITLDNETEYKLLGIKSYGLGIFHREIKKGKEIKSKNLYQVQKGNFIYSRLGASSGSFGFITEEFNNCFVSNEFPTFNVDKKKLNIEYLNILVTLDFFYKNLASMNTGSALKRLNESKFLNLEIPLPSLEVQQQLVDDYNTKIDLAKNLEEEAENLEKNIDIYLFKILGIELNIKDNAKNIINFIDYQNLDKWGVEFNLGTINSTNILKSKLYPNNKLENLIYINPTTSFNNKNLDKISFLPMECISDIYGEVKKQYEGEISKSKGYTKFQQGDLLWAKITPCMENGKSAVVKDLLNEYGYGSTEFHVLRQKDENIKIEYIYHLLRTKILRQEAKSSFTGSAGQQRVPKTFLENLIIPVPRIEIQNNIINYLNQHKQKIKQLKQQAQQNIKQATEDFENAIFIKGRLC